jgi:hypothetical protein
MLGRLMGNGSKNFAPLYSLSLVYQVEVSLVEIHMLGQIEFLSDSDVILSFLNIWLLLK